MTDLSLTTIDFHGATLIARRGATMADTAVAMKPIVDGMGLDWSGQLAKIRTHPVLSPTMGEIPMVAEDGRIRAMTSLPLTRVNFWLATIHPSKVPDPGTRERVIAYQNECADALYNHFFEKTAAPAAASDPEEIDGPEGLKLRKVNTAARCFGERAAAQLWVKLGLDWVPAMAPALAQADLLDAPHPPGSVTVTVTVTAGGAA